MRLTSILAVSGIALLLASCGSVEDGGGSGKSGSAPVVQCTSTPGSQGSCTQPQELVGEPTETVTNTGWIERKPSFYRFATESGAYYRISMSGYSADLDLYVFDRSGFQDNAIACVSARSSTAPETCLVQAQGEYLFLGVLNNADTYQTFQISRQPAEAPAARGSEEEPYDLGYTPVTFAGSVDDGASFFQVAVATDGVYTVRLEQLDGDADLYVSAESFAPVAAATTAPPPASCSSLNWFTADEVCQVTVTGDTLYVAVDGSYAKSGATFQLTVKKTGGAYSNEGDAEHPVKLNLGETRQGEVNTESFYWMETQPGHIYRFSGPWSIAIHDDDASFDSTSLVCLSCYFQASGNAVYLRVTTNGPERYSLKAEEIPLDQPIPKSAGGMAPSLYLARGVSTYSGLVNVVKTIGSAFGSSAFEFRTVPGTYYRISVGAQGEDIRATTFFSSGLGGCGYSLDVLGDFHCIFQATKATSGVYLDGVADASQVMEVGLSIQQIEAPYSEGTLEEPVDLGEASGSFTGSVSHKAPSYYRFDAKPGATYSFKVTSAVVAGNPYHVENGLFPQAGMVDGYITDGADETVDNTCCTFTPGTDTILLVLYPLSVAGGPINIVIAEENGQFPAEGIVGGPVELDPLGHPHKGTVSVDHSSYVFQTVKDQLYGLRLEHPTNPGVRGKFHLDFYSCVAMDGKECRFYGTGKPIEFTVTGGPAAYVLSLYPTKLPPNEGTAFDPMVLTLPVAHRGTSGYEESYYKIALDPAVRYRWWVSTIDGSALGWYHGGPPGVAINCGWAHLPCSVTGRSVLNLYVDGGSLGANFMLYVEPQP